MQVRKNTPVESMFLMHVVHLVNETWDVITCIQSLYTYCYTKYFLRSRLSNIYFNRPISFGIHAERPSTSNTCPPQGQVITLQRVKIFTYLHTHGNRRKSVEFQSKKRRFSMHTKITNTDSTWVRADSWCFLEQTAFTGRICPPPPLPSPPGSFPGLSSPCLAGWAGLPVPARTRSLAGTGAGSTRDAPRRRRWHRPVAPLRVVPRPKRGTQRRTKRSVNDRSERRPNRTNLRSR